VKYLLLLVLALLGLWWVRASGRTRASSDAAHKRSDDATQEMVSCTLCGLHLPRQEAVSGLRGVYCCQDHRERNEG